MKKQGLLFLLCLPLCLFSQENQSTLSPLKSFQFQVGLNVTQFIKQFAVPNNLAIGTTSPYDFNAKVLYKLNDNTRTGLRIGYGYTDTRDASFTPSFNSETSTEVNNSFLRIGVEWQRQFSKHWVMYYGLDYIWSLQDRITTNSFASSPTITTKSVTTDGEHITGAGPLLGIQFNITPNICIGTELSLYFTQFKGGSTTIQTRSDGAPINNPVAQTLTNGRSSKLLLPNFVNFNFMF